jgi:hypothetical protein
VVKLRVIVADGAGNKRTLTRQIRLPALMFMLTLGDHSRAA